MNKIQLTNEMFMTTPIGDIPINSEGTRQLSDALAQKMMENKEVINNHVKILKHGSEPEENKLYFICENCQCEFATLKQYCVHKEIAYNPVCYEYSTNCPECNSTCYGMDRELYIYRVGRNRK